MRNYLPRLFHNITLNPASVAGGPVTPSDLVGGLEYPYTKIAYGADGTVTKVSATNGLPINGSQSAASTTSWTSATALNTANSISVVGFNTVSIAIIQGTTLTAGAVTFEVSPDGTNWIPVAAARIDQFGVQSVYTLTASTNIGFSTSVDGFTNFRVRLSTVITGTATVSILVIAQTFAIEPIVNAGQPDVRPNNLCVTATGAVNTAVTCTLPAVTGMFHYISAIQITKLYSVVGVAAGAGVIITTTNIPGTPSFTTEQLASPAGSAPVVVNIQPSMPIKSTAAGTATTIVCPLQLQTIWRINVFYFVAP